MKRPRPRAGPSPPPPSRPNHSRVETPAISRVSSGWSTLLICLTLTFLTLAVYWPVLHHEFINLDDPVYVLGNPHVLSGFTWDNVKAAFEAGYAGNWHPLTWVSHLLDVQLFGLNAGNHHFTSLLWHIANTLLLFLLLRQMTAAPRRSAAVAALFALHPLHVESVAWVAERKDVLSGFFFMLTLLAYVRYVESRKQKAEWQQSTSSIRHRASVFYLLAIFCFALGLMSKPMLVTLPFVLLLLDYWPLRRFEGVRPPSGAATSEKSGAPISTGALSSLALAAPEDGRTPIWPLLLEKLPFIALSAASCIITVLAQHRGSAVATLDVVPLGMRFENALVSPVAYIREMFWPVSLGVYYPLGNEISAWQVVCAAIIVIGLSALTLTSLRGRPYLGVGWFWFLGMLIPVIGLVQVGLQARADRYTYLPLIGLFIGIIWWTNEALVNWRFRRTLLTGAAATLGLACIAISRTQVGFWKDSETLYRHTLEVTADNSIIHQNLGTWLITQQRYAEAEQQLAEAIKIYPQLADSRGAMALALACQGRSKEVIPFCRNALELDARLVEPHFLLANALLKQGERKEAIAEYRATLALAPNHFWALNDLAWVLATSSDGSLRNGAEAVDCAERACKLTRFEDPQFIGTLAAAYAEAGSFEEAIRTGERAATLALAVGRTELAKKNQQLLELYRAYTPVREQDSR